MAYSTRNTLCHQVESLARQFAQTPGLPFAEVLSPNRSKRLSTPKASAASIASTPRLPPCACFWPKPSIPIPRCGKSIGIREEDWPTDEEGIARHLALMDQIEPLETTAEEEAAWHAARKSRKEWEKANFDKRSRRIEELFE